MAWSPTNSTQENTFLVHGGNPLNNVYRYLTGQNLGLISPNLEPRITTPTHFYDEALRIKDSDGDADVIFDTTDLNLSTDAHQYVRFPEITNTESSHKIDTITMDKTTATLEKKTIVLSDNHVKATSAVAGDLVAFTDIGSGVIDLRRVPKGTAGQYPKLNGTADGYVWATPGTEIGTGVINDSMIAAHTSTKITITTKGQLNSQIAYKDDTAWLTNAMVSSVDWAKLTSVPATFTPSAHNHAAGDINSGTLAVARGGTGKTTFTQHALLKGGASNAYDEIAPGTDGKVLKMVSGTPAWADETGGGASDLDDLDDVTITTPNDGDILIYDTGVFVNEPQSSLSIDWSQLDSVPSSFTPSSHASSHQSGGGDEISIDWSQITTGIPSTFTPSAHNHAATEITSGTLVVARGGTGKTTFTQHALLKGGSSNTYDEIAVGSNDQVLAVVSGTPAWKSLDSERTGKALANGNGSTTVFNIAHGLGATPSYAFVDCSSHAIARTWAVDGTNITVTFASAPSSGTNNVIIYWRVIE